MEASNKNYEAEMPPTGGIPGEMIATQQGGLKNQNGDLKGGSNSVALRKQN